MYNILFNYPSISYLMQSGIYNYWITESINALDEDIFYKDIVDSNEFLDNSKTLISKRLLNIFLFLIYIMFSSLFVFILEIIIKNSQNLM